MSAHARLALATLTFNLRLAASAEAREMLDRWPLGDRALDFAEHYRTLCRFLDIAEPMSEQIGLVALGVCAYRQADGTKIVMMSVGLDPLVEVGRIPISEVSA